MPNFMDAFRKMRSVFLPEVAKATEAAGEFHIKPFTDEELSAYAHRFADQKKIREILMRPTDPYYDRFRPDIKKKLRAMPTIGLTNEVLRERSFTQGHTGFHGKSA